MPPPPRRPARASPSGWSCRRRRCFHSCRSGRRRRSPSRSSGCRVPDSSGVAAAALGGSAPWFVVAAAAIVGLAAPRHRKLGAADPGRTHRFGQARPGPARCPPRGRGDARGAPAARRAGRRVDWTLRRRPGDHRAGRRTADTLRRPRRSRQRHRGVRRRAALDSRPAWSRSQPRHTGQRHLGRGRHPPDRDDVGRLHTASTPACQPPRRSRRAHR